MTNGKLLCKLQGVIISSSYLFKSSAASTTVLRYLKGPVLPPRPNGEGKAIIVYSNTASMVPERHWEMSLVRSCWDDHWQKSRRVAPWGGGFPGDRMGELSSKPSPLTPPAPLWVVQPGHSSSSPSSSRSLAMPTFRLPGHHPSTSHPPSFSFCNADTGVPPSSLSPSCSPRTRVESKVEVARPASPLCRGPAAPAAQLDLRHAALQQLW